MAHAEQEAKIIAHIKLLDTMKSELREKVRNQIYALSREKANLQSKRSRLLRKKTLLSPEKCMNIVKRKNKYSKSYYDRVTRPKRLAQKRQETAATQT